MREKISYNCKKALISCAVSTEHKGIILKFKGEKELQVLLTWSQVEELVVEIEDAQERKQDGEEE